LVDAWVYAYTDFGEGRDRSPFPILRASVPVGAIGSTLRFAAIIDTGGPVTIVSREMAELLAPLTPIGDTLTLRLAGARYEAHLHTAELQIHPPPGIVGASRRWAGPVGTIEPWPHHGTAVIFGQAGFLDQITVTFGNEGFALEDRQEFARRFSVPPS
jgi:hypothetical protein